MDSSICKVVLRGRRASDSSGRGVGSRIVAKKKEHHDPDDQLFQKTPYLPYTSDNLDLLPPLMPGFFTLLRLSSCFSRFCFRFIAHSNFRLYIQLRLCFRNDIVAEDRRNDDGCSCRGNCRASPGPTGSGTRMSRPAKKVDYFLSITRGHAA